jgi:enoyl-CoA hydratase/carnithine racemase
MYYQPEQVSLLPQHTFAQIKVEVQTNTLVVTLARPKAKNAMSPTMIREYAYAFAYAHHTPEIWAIVIRAEGDVWCAGMDLKAMKGQEEPTNSTIPLPTGEIVIAELLRKVHKPIIAEVQAPVYAGGLLLVGSAHYVVATEEAKLGLPEVKRGLYPFQVMAMLLQNLPTRQVLDWCMRGRTITAQEAHKWGLITHLVGKTEVEATTQTLLAELFENSPTAIRMGLQAFDEMRHIADEERQAFLKKIFEQTAQTQDAQEGMQAFIEKRKPVWKGV